MLKKNAEIISKLILDQNKKDKGQNNCNINIPEFNDPFICSESDYQLFENVFNNVPIQITNTNTKFLKIFASKFNIKELTQLLELFESYYDTITSYSLLQIQKNISNELININEDNIGALLNRFDEISKNAEINILTSEFIYNIFLNLCFIRPTKIELFINFLKKYEETTKGSQFQSFKKSLLKEFNESNKNERFYRYQRTIKEKLDLNHSLKTMQFVLYYLCSQKEIKETDFIAHQTDDYYFNHNFNDHRQRESMKKYTKDEIEEYKKTGYCPKQIYHAIKNDDLDLFTEMITQSQDTNLEFSKNLPILVYERNPDICYDNEYSISYLNLAAFYGSEQIFNYILMNTNPADIEYVTLRMAFFGGNIAIISKCIEKVEMDDSILENCIIIAIKYNYEEVLEWLFENYEVMKTRIFGIETINRLIENSIKFNNIEVLIYLLSNGIDHTSLFTYSLVHNQSILMNLTKMLPYNCSFSSKYIKDVSLSPFRFKYNEILFFFLTCRSSFYCNLSKST